MSFGRGIAKTSCGGGGNIGSPTSSNISSRSRVTTTPRSSSFCPKQQTKHGRGGKAMILENNVQWGPKQSGTESERVGRVARGGEGNYSNQDFLAALSSPVSAFASFFCYAWRTIGKLSLHVHESTVGTGRLLLSARPKHREKHRFLQ